VTLPREERSAGGIDEKGNLGTLGPVVRVASGAHPVLHESVGGERFPLLPGPGHLITLIPSGP
jgi:hypothetical protein